MILRRLSDSCYSEILPAWTGATVALLGGGPSLTVDRVEMVGAARSRDGLRVVAINNAYQLAPWADLLYADYASDDWRAEHAARVDAEFAGEIAALDGGGKFTLPGRVHLLSQQDLPAQRTYSMPGAGDTRLIAGRNSMHQALNLAVLAGAARVLLLGCDGGPRDGRTHWHGGHFNRTIPPDFWTDMRTAFSAQENALASRGVEVLNCSPDSAIRSFPMMELDDALRLESDAQRDLVSA